MFGSWEVSFDRDPGRAGTFCVAKSPHPPNRARRTPLPHRKESVAMCGAERYRRAQESRFPTQYRVADAIRSGDR